MRKGEVKQTRLFTKKLVDKRTFEQLVEEFIRQCEITNKAEQTVKSYKYHARYFIGFLGENFPCENITLETIEDYVRYMRNEKSIDNGVTLNSYIRNISPIIKYGYKKRYISSDFEMPQIKEQETFKEIYTKEELKLLLSKPKANDFVTLRTWAVIWTFASTGVRMRELRELRVKNLDLLNRTIAVNKTKNKKARYLPISESLLEVLDRYLELRGGESEDYLFCSVYNEILSPTGLQKSIKKYCNSRGVEKTSLHLFRHTFITNAVNKNVSPLILQKITGHSTMKELNKYYNAKTEDIVNIIDDIAPKQSKKENYFKKKR